MQPYPVGEGLFGEFAPREGEHRQVVDEVDAVVIGLSD